MMSLWDALRMNMMISYQELVRTFLSLISYPVRSIKYDTKLIVGVISINIGAQFALIHQKMNG